MAQKFKIKAINLCAVYHYSKNENLHRKMPNCYSLDELEEDFLLDLLELELLDFELLELEDLELLLLELFEVLDSVELSEVEVAPVGSPYNLE